MTLNLSEKACSGCTKTTYCTAMQKLQHIEGASEYWPDYLKEAAEWWIDLDCPNRVEEDG